MGLSLKTTARTIRIHTPSLDGMERRLPRGLPRVIHNKDSHINSRATLTNSSDPLDKATLHNKVNTHLDMVHHNPY